MEEELVNLRAELVREKAERAKLEEECDLLAFSNDRLTGELAKLKAIVESHQLSTEDVTKANLDGTEAADVDVFIEGDNKYANALSLKVLDANSGKNVLCTAFIVLEEGDVLLSGGVDQCLHGFNSAGIRLFSFKLSGPLLAIDVHEQTIACCMMDGSLAVVRCNCCFYQIHLPFNHSNVISGDLICWRALRRPASGRVPGALQVRSGCEVQQKRLSARHCIAR